MRFCPKCKINKEDAEFYMRPDRKGRLQSYCRACNKEATLTRQRELKRLAVEYKGGKCVDCGYAGHPAAFDFHHLDPDEKDFTIGQMTSTKWSSKIEKELDKCVLLCATCHRLRHVKYASLA